MRWRFGRDYGVPYRTNGTDVEVLPWYYRCGEGVGVERELDKLAYRWAGRGEWESRSEIDWDVAEALWAREVGL